MSTDFKSEKDEFVAGASLMVKRYLLVLETEQVERQNNLKKSTSKCTIV